MAWIKKNLFMVLATVISLGLLVYAVMFVRQRVAADKAVNEELDQAASQFQQLVTRKVHPGTEKVNNIENAKRELNNLQGFLTNVHAYLTGPEVPKGLNNRDFRVLLETSLAKLRDEADQKGITLPNTNYWFTFSVYKSAVDFREDVVGLAAQLKDIESIMRILYDARVHGIAGLARVAVSDADFQATTEYIQGRQPKTNDWAILTGYQVTFQGFSSELARVMEGLANAKQCFIVKSVGVAKAPEERKPSAPVAPVNVIGPMQPMNPYGPYGPGGMRPGMGMGPDSMRYMPQPRMAMPPPRAAAPAPKAGGLETVVNEAKLRFTLQLDSVRLKPKEQQQEQPQPAQQQAQAQTQPPPQ